MSVESDQVEMVGVEPELSPNGELIELEAYPTYEGQDQVSEWEEYWGVKYDEHTHGDKCICAAVPIFTAYTRSVGAFREVYPDVVTSLSTLNFLDF